MKLVPFRVSPRLDTKPWGGTRLATFGYMTDGPEPLGEVVISASDTRVAGGPYDGRTLDDLVKLDPLAMIGRLGVDATGGRSLFPLLVKLIDAAEHLSIQVHPDDMRAAAVGSPGKTEAWVVLDVAERDSLLFAGVHEGVTSDQVATAVAAGPGRTAELLRRLPARPGNCLFLPAGTLHALGAGMTVYEVQQPCDVTYRLDEWGRAGIDGKPRQLHVEEAMEATDLSIRPESIELVRLPGPPPRDLLVACRYFALDRWTIGAGESITLSAADSAQVVTLLSGAVAIGEIGSNSDSIRLAAGQTAIVPARCGVVDATAAGDSVVLRAWVPDLRAEIVGPAMAAGIGRDRLVALSAPLPDLADAIPIG